MHSPTPTRKPDPIVVVLAVAGITASLMQTLVVPLLGDMPRLLHTSASNATWVVTATLLAGSVATTVLGRLGDLYGKRRMLLVCTVPLIAGSVICALAGSLAAMIIGRALQGIGMGIIPLGISALRDLLPPDRLGSAIALISSSLGIGGALGLPLAAIVAERSSWRALFWGAAVLGSVIALLIRRYVPATPPRATGTFDFVGAGVLGTGLICLLLSVSKGADWGWTSGTTLGLGAAAAAILLTWGWWELRTRHPLVDLRITARPQVLVTNIASIALGLSMYAQALILPQLLQLPESTGHGLGQSMLAMGLWMAPAGLVMMLLSPVGARLSDARGPKTTLVVGSLVLALGYGSSVVMLGSPWAVMIVSAVCAMGVGLAYGAMPALIMAGVPETDTAAANSFNTLMRSIGTSVSAAMVGVVLSQMTVERGGLAVPSEGAFRTGMLIGCALALAAAAVAAAIPARRARPDGLTCTPGDGQAQRETRGGLGYAHVPPAAP